MLPHLVQSSIWLFLPLLLLGFYRKKWWMPGIVFVFLFLLGLMQESLIFSDLWMLPSYTNLWENGLSVFLWVLLGLLWSAAFPVRKIYSARLTAFLMGLCLGEIALAFLVLKAVSDPKQRGSALFAGMAGAVLSPVGDLGHFGFGIQSEYWYALPLISLVSLGVSGKDEIEWKEEEEATALPYILGILISLMLVFSPDHQLLVLGVAVLGLSVVNRAILKIPHSLLVLVALSFLAIVIATAGGVPELLAWSLERSQFTYATYLNGLLLLISTLVSALFGEWNAVILGQALQERALGIQKQELWTMMGLGTAIGGVSPLILAGVWRENWKRACLLIFVLLLLLLLLV
jgi:hypothetical protein